MKTLLGIIAMNKSSYIALLIALLFCWAVYAVNEDSQHYWQNVGPRWDKMFNPSHYND